MLVMRHRRMPVLLLALVVSLLLVTLQHRMMMLSRLGVVAASLVMMRMGLLLPLLPLLPTLVSLLAPSSSAVIECALWPRGAT